MRGFYFNLARQGYQSPTSREDEIAAHKRQQQALLSQVKANGPVAIKYIRDWANTQGITEEQLNTWQNQAQPVVVALYGVSTFRLALDGTVTLRHPYNDDTTLPLLYENAPQEFLNNAVTALSGSLYQTLNG